MPLLFNNINKKINYLKEKSMRGELNPEVLLRFKRLESSGALERARYDKNIARLIDQLIALDNASNQKSVLEIVEEQMEIEEDVANKTKVALDYVKNNLENKFPNIKFDKAFLKANESRYKGMGLDGVFTIGITPDGEEIKVSLNDMTISDGKYTIYTVINQLRATMNEEDASLANKFMKKGLTQNGAYSNVHKFKMDTCKYLDFLEVLVAEFVVSATTRDEKYQESIGFTPNPAFYRIIEMARTAIVKFNQTMPGSIAYDKAVKENVMIDKDGRIKEGMLGRWLSYNKREGMSSYFEDYNNYERIAASEVCRKTHTALSYVSRNIDNKFYKLGFDKDFLDKVKDKIANTPLAGKFLIGINSNGDEEKISLDDMTIQNGKYPIYMIYQRLRETLDRDLRQVFVKNGLSQNDAIAKSEKVQLEIRKNLDYLEWLTNSYVVGATSKDQDYQKIIGLDINPALTRMVFEASEAINIFMTTRAGIRTKELGKDFFDANGNVIDGMLGEWFYLNCKEGLKLQPTNYSRSDYQKENRKR